MLRFPDNENFYNCISVEFLIVFKRIKASYVLNLYVSVETHLHFSHRYKRYIKFHLKTNTDILSMLSQKAFLSQLLVFSSLTYIHELGPHHETRCLGYIHIVLMGFCRKNRSQNSKESTWEKKS